MKKRLFEILESRKGGVSRTVNIFILLLILVNLVFVILETEKGLYRKYTNLFHFVEVFSVLVFTVEYLLRLWTCTENPKYCRPITGRIRYALTFYLMIDLLAILPFYLPMLITFDLRFIRILRFFRVFRILKLQRYSKAVKTLTEVFRDKKEELGITVFAIVIILLLSSSLLYFVEHEAQPEVFSSIPASMWWGIATLTTVGYGDIYPVTPIGKFLSAIISLLGIGFVAIPTGVLAAGFTEKIGKKKPVLCPHCGKELD
jgi:voltage-gated potassium channel